MVKKTRTQMKRNPHQRQGKRTNGTYLTLEKRTRAMHLRNSKREKRRQRAKERNQQN